MPKQSIIWIDIINSPQVNFFKPFVKLWEDEGFRIIITTRDLSNTIDLLKQMGWKYKEIGGHAGKNPLLKLLNFPLRTILLRSYLKKIKPNVGISHSSFYSPLVCKLLNIPSIYLNDNEYAHGNYLAFKFSTKVLLPEFLEHKSKKLGWVKKYSIEFYPGIKEGIYLSQLEKLDSPKKGNKKVLNSIYIRLEPWSAQYYSGRRNFIDQLIKELGKKYFVIILPRSQEQIDYYKSMKGLQIQISEESMDFFQIFKDCDLFIGAGGSMTREFALLGKPAISIYQDELLEVDKFLINQKKMFYFRDLQLKDVKSIFDLKYKHNNTNLLSKGISAFKLIDKMVKQYAN